MIIYSASPSILSGKFVRVHPHRLPSFAFARPLLRKAKTLRLVTLSDLEDGRKGQKANEQKEKVLPARESNPALKRIEVTLEEKGEREEVSRRRRA